MISLSSVREEAVRPLARDYDKLFELLKYEKENGGNRSLHGPASHLMRMASS